MTDLADKYAFFLVALAMLAALLIPLNLLTVRRFHHDEALYANWSLQILSGSDSWLEHTAVDKPPLFIYMVAGSMWLLGVTETAARTVSLLATVATVWLTFMLGRRLYNNETGLVATWLVALSPLVILFSPAALTDPLLMALIMASCLAAAYGWAGWAGVGLGLAIATKQQALFFTPLVLALLISNSGWQTVRNIIRTFSLFLLTTCLTLTPVFVWDFSRSQTPGFWQLSLDNYGGIKATTAGFAERWWGFVELLQYGTASNLLNSIFIIVMPLLLFYGLWQLNIKQAHRQSLTDWILFIFAFAFLAVHVFLSFQLWGRYLLGLMPILALLFARTLLLPYEISYRLPAFVPAAKLLTALVIAFLLIFSLSAPVRDAANGRYPLGSNSNALSGIEQITAYLQGHAGANNTLYHRWLGEQWRFYLWGYPYDLQYWSSPAELAARAESGDLITFPAWHSETEARLTLSAIGLGLRELTRAYTPAGYPSIILYRIESK